VNKREGGRSKLRKETVNQDSGTQEPKKAGMNLKGMDKTEREQSKLRKEIFPPIRVRLGLAPRLTILVEKIYK
jgi:hypothetical protein